MWLLFSSTFPLKKTAHVHIQVIRLIELQKTLSISSQLLLPRRFEGDFK